MPASRTCPLLAVLYVLCVCSVGRVWSLTLQEIIGNNAQLSRFGALVDEVAVNDPNIWSLVEKAGTVFAPINAAFDQIPAISDANKPELVKNHVPANAWTFNRFTETLALLKINFTKINSKAQEKPLLFHHEHDNYFVNGAMLVTRTYTTPPVDQIVVTLDSGAVSKNLFMIDRVLDKLGHKDNFYEHVAREVATTSEFGKLIKVYEASNTAESNAFITLLKEGKGTFFVPNNNELLNEYIKPALEKLKTNLTQLGQVLKSHFINNNFIYIRYLHEKIPWITEGLPFISHGNPDHDGIVYLSGGSVEAEIDREASNVTMTNGVVHMIKAMLHFPYASCYVLIMRNQLIGHEYQEAITSLSMLKSALSNADTPVTVFAPASTATSTGRFIELVTELKNMDPGADKDATELAKVIKSGILSGTRSLQDLRQGKEFTTINNLKLTVSEQGQGQDVYVSVGGISARILTTSDLGATNGVVHLVDKVVGMNGTTIWDRMNDNFPAQIQSFMSLVRSTKMDIVLNDLNQRLTVFVPVDQSIERKKASSPSFKEFLTEAKHSAGRLVFVKRHICLTATKIERGQEISLQTLNTGETLQVDATRNVFEVIYRGIKAAIVTPPNIPTDNGFLQRINDEVLYVKADYDLSAILGASTVTYSFWMSLLSVIITLLLQLT